MIKQGLLLDAHLKQSGFRSSTNTHGVQMNNQLKRALYLMVLMMFFIYLFAPFAVQAQSGNVVLWNRLGSAYEITHSQIGPNGTLVGDNYTFEAAQFGNGYIRKATGANHVSFPGSVLGGLTKRGSIGVWINPKVSQPQPYVYGVFGLVGAAYYGGHSNNVFIFWGDGVTGRSIWGGISLGNDFVETDPWREQFVATPGIPFHVAISWDIDGIAGTIDTVRTYLNGALIGKASGSWDPNLTANNDIILGYSPDSGGYNKFVTDNIVVWDYAKTDFSDRFNENPINCEPGALPKLSVGITQKTGIQKTRVWTLTLSSTNNCPAENAQFDAFTLLQTAGSSCTPVITSPLSFPLGVGNIAANTQASGTVTLDFTGCPNNARFKATIPFSSNNGAVTGSKTLNNQFR